MLALIGAVPVAAQSMPPPDAGDLERSWARVDQQLEPLNRDAVKVTVGELLQTARTLELRRLTPASLALVVRSRSATHDDARFLLREATRLDPESPEAWFALSYESLRTGAPFAAMSESTRAVATLFEDARWSAFISSTLLISGIVGGLAAWILWAVLIVRRCLPRLWHDFMELGERWQLHANTLGLALALLLLPAFLAGDLVWVLLWIFALSWAYTTWGRKTIGIIGLLLVVGTPTLVEIGVRGLTQPANPVLQATNALTERRWAPESLDEIGSLQDVLGDRPDFHRLLGDCYRQFGRLDAAAWAYREGLRLDPDNGKLALAIGTVHFLEGDYNAALEAFQRARESGVDPVVTNYNLSLTLAHTYHFRESDEALIAARRAGEQRLRELTAMRDEGPILPVFSATDARRLLHDSDPVLLLNRGVLTPPLALETTLMHPLALAAMVALFISVLHFLVRERFGGFAATCTKCGRSFCRRCKFSDESQSYCSQCINIFLKKDLVGVEDQMAKRRRVARRQWWRAVERRLADTVVPGLGLAFSGRPWLGGVFVVTATVCVTLGFFWVPLFVRPGLLETSLWLPTAFCAAIWILLVILAHVIPTERA